MFRSLSFTPESRFHFRDTLAANCLTMYRLNDMWSFTGKRITWELESYFTNCPADECEALLLAVRAWGAFARATGDEVNRITPSDEWMRLFNNVGQAVMFDLPRHLNAVQTERFNKVCSEVFMAGWKALPYPSPLPPVGGGVPSGK